MTPFVDHLFDNSYKKHHSSKAPSPFVSFDPEVHSRVPPGRLTSRINLLHVQHQLSMHPASRVYAL